MKFSSTKTSGSYYDRTNAISYALSKIFQNPLLGVAARGIEDSYNAKELVVLVILAGQHMVSRARPMHIRTFLAIAAVPAPVQ